MKDGRFSFGENLPKKRKNDTFTPENRNIVLKRRNIVVEMTKNKDKHLEIEWSGEKLQLLDYKNTESRFFVRTDKSLEDVRKVFGNVEIVDGVIPNEIGFITSHTKESEFEEKAEKLGIINRIRIN